MNSKMSTIYNILEWITKFAYVNLLWIVFTFVGGVILGFYPATTAMFSLVRNWLRGKTDQPVFATFWKSYKRYFFESNLLGLIINVILAIIAVDILYTQMNVFEQLTWTNIPLFAFMLLVLFFLFYIFPSFAHFDLKMFPLIKNAFLIMLISPIYTFLIVICLVSIYFIMRVIPALFFIFGGSVYAFITTWVFLYAVDNIQQKQAKK